eukprot:SM000086S23040  [mRNA]  locus=s86:275928:277793:- [translate_table: standard]
MIVATQDELLGVLEALAVEDTVITANAVEGQEKHLSDWLCQTQRLGLTNVLLSTSSDALAKRLAAAGFAVYLLQESAEQEAEWQDTPQAETLARFEMIRLILAAGYSTLLADADSLWRVDPLQHMEPPDADVYSVTDYKLEKKMGYGLLFVRNSENSVVFWATVARHYRTLMNSTAAKLARMDSERGRKRYVDKVLGPDQPYRLLASEAMREAGLLRVAVLHNRQFMRMKVYQRRTAAAKGGGGGGARKAMRKRPVLVHGLADSAAGEVANLMRELRLWSGTTDFLCRCRVGC